MNKPKMIQIQLRTAKQLARVLSKLEESSCVGCTGGSHEDSCPAREAWQLRNNLTQRINHPLRNQKV